MGVWDGIMPFPAHNAPENCSRWSCVNYYDVQLQINDILEASLGQLQARNHPHAEAVAAALNRTGSTERRSALLLTPSSPLRQRALQTAHASKAVATAGLRSQSITLNDPDHRN